MQGLAKWKDDDKIAEIKFSRMWIKGWLRRNALRKRRITAQSKKLPAPEEVQKRMAEIQKVIVDGGYDEDEVFSGDETGILFGAQPLRQYIPLSADRATAPEGDDKARFTSFLFGSAGKGMEPSFNIVKCASQNPYDLSGTRVIHNLFIQHFSADEGWELKKWERTMDLPVKNKKDGAHQRVVCKRFFIEHTNGTIVTCQNSAWMDSAGIAMWCDTQLGPRMKQRGKKCLMVWDNCGPHKVAGVRKVFDEWGIKAMELPPKMTDILQVMDLIVNGPLKAAIRRHRIEGLFNYFQSWKIKRLAAGAARNPLPGFEPPKPMLADGLKALFDCLNTTLAAENFTSAMSRTFVKVGLKTREDNEFAIYSAHKKLGMTKDLLPSTEKAVWNEVCEGHLGESASFSEIASEVSFVTREEDEAAAAQPQGVEEEEDNEGDA